MAVGTNISSKIGEERKMRLMQSRMAKSKVNSENKEAEQKPEVNMIEGTFMLLVAGLADLVDYLIIGSIPFVGDLLDFMIGGIIYFWVKIRGYDKATTYMPYLPGGSMLIELIPFGDLLPSFTVAVLGIILLNSPYTKKMIGRLKKAVKIAKFAV